MSRLRAEMMPAVTEPPRPKGLPTASTQSPTRTSFELPQMVLGRGDVGLTFSSARSVSGSVPITSAS